MVYNNPKQNNIREAVSSIADDRIRKSNPMDLFVVKQVNTYETADRTEYTCDVIQLNGIQTYENVPVMSIALGNGRGFMCLPLEGDIVVVSFMNMTNSPVIVGSMFNQFSGDKSDNVLDLKKNEFVLINKINGAYIFANENDGIIIKNSLGFLKLNPDGTITMNDYTFPKNDGTAGQVLKTNGSGVLFWSNDNI
mgnify:CR=1 FL=1